MTRAVLRLGLMLMPIALSEFPTAAFAQYASACPPPRKLAAGACVVACPAGYEDRGRACVFQSLSR